MRILHIITSLKTGGAEKLMVDLLPRLKSKDVDVELLTFDGTPTTFRKNLEGSGVLVHDFGQLRSPYSIKNLINLIPFLQKYDIVHTHNTACQLFAALGSLLCSVVLCTTEHNTSNRRRGSRWYAPFDRWMYSRYKRVICISDKTEENLLNYLPGFPSTTKTIYNGIPVATYSNAIQNSQFLKEYTNCRKIMMVAGFRYQKDQPTVIRSMALLPEDIHLFLIGDGPEKSKCEKLAKDLNLSERIHFMGIRNDVPSLLKCADVCVISSHWEGFGLAAVEGMAAGKPVVASDIPGVAEVVKGAGILFEKGNCRNLADTIKQLLDNNDLYRTTAKNCLLRAEYYNIDTMVDGYISVYNDLLNRK